jgi:hypothetical protein
MTEVRYPSIYVPLVGEDGNAISILARVDRALRDAGVDSDDRDFFYEEATKGDYNHLLRTVMSWVETYDPDPKEFS